MKNKNKVFVLSLSTLLLLSCQGESQKSASSEENEPASSLVSSEKENSSTEEIKGDANFGLSEDKTYFILKKCPEALAKTYEVPATYKGLPVKEITKDAFMNCILLENLIIPNSVTKIAKYFLTNNASKLKSLSIPFIGETADDTKGYLGMLFGIGDVTGKNFTQVYASNFQTLKITNQPILPAGLLAGSETLQTVVIENCEEIRTGALQNLSELISLSLPDGLKKIGIGAFASDVKLASLTIPDSVTDIDAQAFYRLPFETFKLPKSLTNFTYYQDMPNLKEWQIDQDNEHFVVEDGVLYSKDFKTLINVPAKKVLDGFSLKSSVTEIGKYAFSATGVTNIDLSNVSKINSFAFFLAPALTSVTFGKGLSFIGSQAFASCTSLTNVAFFETTTSESFAWENLVFSSCNKLTKILLPNYIHDIPSSTFASCTSLSEITISGHLKSIGLLAFSKTAITELEVTFMDEGSIGSSIFKNAPIRKFALHFEENVKTYPTISSLGFAGTPTIAVDTEEIATSLKSAWANCPEVAALILAPGKISEEFVIEENTLVKYDASKSSDPTKIIIPDTVTAINANVFSNLKEVKYIYVPSSVVSVATKAFAGLGNLLVMEFGHEDLSSIKTSGYFYAAFGQNNESMKCVYALKNQTQTNKFVELSDIYGESLIATSQDDFVADYTNSEVYNASETTLLLNHSNATTYTFKDTVTKVGKFAFEKQSKLQSVVWNNVTEIGQSAFKECRGLSELTFGEKIVKIGSSGFNKCSGLTSLAFQGATEIDDNAFFGDEDNAYTITSLDFGKKLTKIGSCAFSYALSSVEVLIPASCKEVIYDAFDYFSDQEDAAIYFENPVETYQYDDPDNGVWVDDFMSAAWDNNEVLVAFYSETAPANPIANDYRYWHYDASNNKVLYE